MKTSFFKRFVFLILVLSSLRVTAQNSSIDSLQNILKSQKEDSNKVNTLNLLSQTWIDIQNFSESMQYAQQALSLAEKIKFLKGKATAQFNIGISHYSESNFQEALKSLLLSLEISQKINDEVGIANSQLKIGQTFTNQGKFIEAQQYLYPALKLAEKINDKKRLVSHYT